VSGKLAGLLAPIIHKADPLIASEDRICALRAGSDSQILRSAGGDYDHGALWFDLEPGVRPSLNAAQGLFLGNSHMQFASSSDAINRWISSNAIRFYLMGFAYWANHLFEGALLRRFEPTAKVYVINIDNFFDQRETPPAPARTRRTRRSSTSF